MKLSVNLQGLHIFSVCCEHGTTYNSHLENMMTETMIVLKGRLFFHHTTTMKFQGLIKGFAVTVPLQFNYAKLEPSKPLLSCSADCEVVNSSSCDSVCCGVTSSMRNSGGSGGPDGRRSTVTVSPGSASRGIKWFLEGWPSWQFLRTVLTRDISSTI